jgi:hypothetical protein
MRQGITRQAKAAVLTAVAVLLPAIFSAASSAATAGHEADGRVAWLDAQAGVPSTVDLADVSAAPGGIVVAVGRSTADSSAVAYRYNGAAWVADTVQLADLPVGAHDSRLVDVAATSAGALAVGTYLDGSNVTQPLVVRVADGAGLSAATATSWARVSALPAGIGAPRAVALRGTQGLVGAAGKVYPFNATTGTIGAEIAPVQPAGPVNSVAFYSDTEAYAVTDMPAASENRADRIYRVTLNAQAALSTMTALPDSSSDTVHADLVSVGAVDAADSIAVEEHPGSSTTAPGYWKPSGGALGGWGRLQMSPQLTADSDPRDISMASNIAAIAGAESGKGAVWRHTGSSPWARDEERASIDADYNVTYVPLSAKPLNGVAPVSSTNIWAVGDGGVVLHYTAMAVKPPPPLPPRPDTVILSGPAQGGQTSSRTPTFTFDTNPGGQPDTQFECRVDGAAFTPCSSPKTVASLTEGQHSFQVRAGNAAGLDLTPATRTFTVDVPNCPTPSPLARSVSVKKRTRSLNVTFRLAAKARVKAIARAGSRTVGATHWQTMERGQRRVVVRFNRPPSRLQLIVKPANRCDP